MKMFFPKVQIQVGEMTAPRESNSVEATASEQRAVY